MPIAPSTSYFTKGARGGPTRLPARTQRDGPLRDAITHVWRANRRVYGVRKVWRQRGLAAAGIEVSVGSRGDAYDNALAESVIGLFKMEVIHHDGPWRSLDDVEDGMMEEEQFDRFGTAPSRVGAPY